MAKEREFWSEDQQDYVRWANARQDGSEIDVTRDGKTWRGTVVSIRAGHDNGKLRYYITLRSND
ncbi:MAG TPA: hypothetical protein VG889_20765 [Rhizomicrobium sp.]|nr:hypothetical protein [Rhizomicrobium sp.]